MIRPRAGPEVDLYLKPRTLDQATAFAAEGGLLLAGATDVFPAHLSRPLPDRIIDLTGVDALRGIHETAHSIRIGAATRWSDIAKAKLPPALLCLQQAAREVGSVQIQNAGTIAGNLCNASPAADGVPPLLALNATVHLVSRQGARDMPLSSFITGYRETALRPGEIVAAIVLPKLAGDCGAAFVKLGARRYLVISIIMAAAVLPRDAQGRIVDARVAVGSASAVACRLPQLELVLAGCERNERPSHRLHTEHLDGLSPIDDVRATAAYRRDAARTLIAEALDRAAGFADGG